MIRDEVVKDILGGFKLLGLHKRAKILDISVYRAKKLLDEYLEAKLIKKWGNSYYLTEKGMKVYATYQREFKEDHTG